MKTAMKQATLALVLGLAAYGTAGNAQAAGTFAGMQIDNTATLAYSVGGFSQTPKAYTASFKVDRKINVTVARTDTAIVVVNPGGTATLTYTVTNLGNDSQDFALSAWGMPNLTVDPFGGAINDNFDGTGVTIAVAGGGTNIINLDPDTQKTVTVTFTVPVGQVDKDVSVYCLKAVAKVVNSNALTAVSQLAADTSGTWTVFADAASSDDGIRDASYSARSACIVAAPSLTITKTPTIIWDQLNFNSSPRFIPGAYVQYVITINNAAGATASALLTTISETLNAATPLDPDLMNKTLNSATPTPDSAATMGFRVNHSAGRSIVGWPKYFTTGAADGDGVDIVGSIITATFATILPAEAGYSAGELKLGESVTITFNVKIN